MIEEKDLNTKILKEKINNILLDDKVYKEYKKNAIKLSNPDSGDKIYNVLKEIVK